MKPEIMYEENYHNEDEKFVSVTVTPIQIIEENIVEGATVPTIVFIDSNGIKCRGSRRHYHQTEAEAWAHIKDDILGAIQYREAEITEMQDEINRYRAFLETIKVEELK